MVKTMKKLLGVSLVILGFSGLSKAGPVGPPSGQPYDPTTVILSTNAAQPGKTFNLSSATVNNLNTSTITANLITIGGVAVSTSVTSGTSVYPATATIQAPFGLNGTTATFSGMINGSSVTLTGIINGTVIHGSSMVITGTITGSNVSGTNTGNVTIGTSNGLSIGDTIDAYALWHLDEAGGTFLGDSSGNNRDGTTNAPRAPGIIGNGIVHVATNSCDFGDIAGFEWNNPFSLEIWIKTTNASTMGLIGKEEDAPDFKGYDLYMSAGQIYFEMISQFTANKYFYLHVAPAINDGSWHHVVMAYNGNGQASGVTIYIDAAPQTNIVNNDTLGGNTIINTSEFMTGEFGHDSFGYIGTYDEAAVYAFTLTPAQVNFRFNGGSGTEQLPLGSGIHQTLSMASASSTSTGSVTAQDWNTFNNKLSTTGNGSGLTGMNKNQVGLSNVQNVDQTVATNVVTGVFDPARLATGTATTSKYLRGDSFWAVLNSTSVGLGNVTNDRQVKVSDYTQKGGILVGISTGVFSVMPPGNDGTILQADSTQATGYRFVISPLSFSVYPASSTASFPHGIHASTGVFTGDISADNATFTGLLSGTTADFTQGNFTGTLGASNLSGTNTGDVSIGSPANGLSLAGQIIVVATAGTTSTGTLTSTDWNAFNQKSNVSIYPASATATFPFGIDMATATIGSLSGVLKASAGAVSGSATTSDVPEGSNLYYTNARTTSAISATSPLTNSNGTISIATATSVSTGVLTATDWNTFNNKSSTSGATLTNPTIVGGSASNFNVTSGTVTVSSLTATAASLTSATVGTLTPTTINGAITNNSTTTLTGKVTGGTYDGTIVNNATMTYTGSAYHTGTSTFSATVYLSSANVSTAVVTGQIQWPDGYLQKKHQILNLADPPYSVTTNDTGDNSAAWASAIATLSISSIPTTILLPAGTIRFTSGITVPMGLVSVLGQNTLLDFTPLTSGTTAMTITGFNGIAYAGNPFLNADCYMAFFKVQGPGSSSGVNGLRYVGEGTNIGPAHSKVYNVAIYDFNQGILFDDHSYLNSFFGVEVFTSSICAHQLNAIDSGERVYFNGGAFFNSATGLWQESAISDIFMDGMSIDGMSSQYLRLEAGDFDAGHMHFEGNFSPDQPNARVVYNPSTGGTIYASIHDSFFTLKSTRAVAAIELDKVAYFTFANNHINGTGIVSQPVFQTGTSFIGTVDGLNNIWTVPDTRYNLQGNVVYWLNDRGIDITTNKSLSLVSSILYPSTVSYSASNIIGTKTDNSTTTFTGGNTFPAITYITGSTGTPNVPFRGSVVSSTTVCGASTSRPMTNNVYTDIGALTLAPGAYDLTGMATMQSASVSGSSAFYGFGTVAGNDGTGLIESVNEVSGPLATNSYDLTSPVGPWRVSPTVTTTYYFKAIASISGGSAKVCGSMRAETK